MESAGDQDKRRLSLEVLQTGPVSSRRGSAQVRINLFFKIENGIDNAIIKQLSDCHKVVTKIGSSYHE